MYAQNSSFTCRNLGLLVEGTLERINNKYHLPCNNNLFNEADNYAFVFAIVRSQDNNNKLTLNNKFWDLTEILKLVRYDQGIRSDLYFFYRAA